MNATQPPPVNFSNMVGPKRRRMRSGGNVSTITNNAPKEIQSSTAHMTSSIDDEKTVQTSKCKGSTTIPIFLKSTLVERWRNHPLMRVFSPRQNAQSWLHQIALHYSVGPCRSRISQIVFLLLLISNFQQKHTR